MRIDDTPSIGSARHPETDGRAPAKSRAPRPTRVGDTAEISERAREIQKAKDAVLSLPDTREARVAEIRARLARGDYNVSSREVADRMFDELTGQASTDEPSGQS